MSAHRIPMWQDGTKLLLEDVFRRIKFTKKPNWELCGFSGAGTAPDGQDIVEFERHIREAGTQQLNSDALELFSRSLIDIYDIHLIGLSGTARVIEIVAFDSSYWDIWVDDERAQYFEPLP